MNTLKNSFRNILFYPSALVGMLVVFLLVFTAAYAMIKIPYNEAIRLWRGGEDVWYRIRNLLRLHGSIIFPAKSMRNHSP